MKIRKDMVFVKFGSEGKWCKVSELEINGVPLVTIYDRQSNLEHIVSEFLEEMKGYYLVKSDQPYIINLGNKLTRVDKLDLYEDKKTDMPLSMYTVKDGKVILDNKKVGALM